MLPQRAPSPLECIDHGAHRDERLRQRLPQDCRGVPPRPAAAARSLGSRFLSEVPPVCICRLCTCSHLFVKYHHHDGCLLCRLSINKEAVPSQPLRRADGGSDGFSHRRRRLRRLHRSQGEFTCQLEQSLQRLRQVLQAHRQLDHHLPRPLHPPRLARRALSGLPPPPLSLII
ncbi:unnamed protein product [Musa acuminata var. zebrina]